MVGMAGTKRRADLELGGRARKLLREVDPCYLSCIGVYVFCVAMFGFFDRLVMVYRLVEGAA